MTKTKDVEKALEFIKHSRALWVDLTFITLSGKPCVITVPATALDDSTFKEGIVIPDEIDDVLPNTLKPLYLVPDPATYALLPWKKDTVMFYCSLENGKDHGKCLKDSRYTLERVVKNYKTVGIEPWVAPLLSFYILDNTVVMNNEQAMMKTAGVESREMPSNPTIYTRTNMKYAPQPYDVYAEARTAIALTLQERFRYSIRRHFHGKDPVGEQVIEFGPTRADASGDAATSLKISAKSIVPSFVSFMPLFNESLSGTAHEIEIAVKSQAFSVFSNAGELTDDALYFIGGVLEHAAAISAFTLPTINSYKWLMKNPRYVAWGHGEGTMIETVRRGNDIYLKFKALDTSANPYLAYTAILCAGLDGLKKKLSPPKEINENIQYMSERSKKKRHIDELPSNLPDSISAFESDNEFVKNSMPDELIADYFEMKMKELDEEKKHISVFEIQKYMDV